MYRLLYFRDPLKIMSFLLMLVTTIQTQKVTNRAMIQKMIVIIMTTVIHPLTDYLMKYKILNSDQKCLLERFRKEKKRMS